MVNPEIATWGVFVLIVNFFAAYFSVLCLYRIFTIGDLLRRGVYITVIFLSLGNFFSLIRMTWSLVLKPLPGIQDWIAQVSYFDRICMLSATIGLAIYLKEKVK